MGKKYEEKQGQVNRSKKSAPIKDIKDIQKIKQYLSGSGKDCDKMWLCLFIVGINVGLRTSDLVELRMKDVVDERGKCVSAVSVVEHKTGKDKTFYLNKAAKDAIKVYLEYRGTVERDGYLFITQKGGPPTVRSVACKLRLLGRELGIKQPLAAHSLRRTFGYQQYKAHIVSDPGFINTLQHLFNHSSPSVTLRYIDIDSEKIQNTYNEVNL